LTVIQQRRRPFEKVIFKAQAAIILLIIFQFSVLASPKTIPFKNKRNEKKSKEISNLEIGVRLLGGTVFFLGNDINDYLNGRNDYNREWAKKNNRLIIDGEYQSIQKAFNLFGELFINFTTRIGAGLEVGKIRISFLGCGKSLTNSLNLPSLSAKITVSHTKR